MDGEIIELRPKFQVDRYKIHDIETVVDRIPVNEAMKTRLADSVQQSLKMGKDLLFVLEEGKEKIVQYSKQLMCIETGLSYETPSPNSFSFNSPYGACPTCKGLGNVYAIDMDLLIPDKDFYIKNYGRWGWSERGVLLNLTLGQGDILITPVQALRFINHIASRGKTAQLRLNLSK